MLLPITAKLRKEEVFSCGLSLEPVINFRAGGVARENRARRGGGRRLWWPHRRVRQRSMARFSPQPRATATFHEGVEAEGLGPIFLISVSQVARRFPIFVAPRS